MKLIKQKKGLILAEALMAIAVLFSAVFLVTLVIDDGSRASKNLANRMQAWAYATEGIEVVKNIKESNRVARPRPLEDEDITDCWRVMKPLNLTLGGEDCSEVEKVEEGGSYYIAEDQSNYTLEFDEDAEDLGGGYTREIVYTRVDDFSADVEVRVNFDNSSVIRNITLYNYVQ